MKKYSSEIFHYETDGMTFSQTYVTKKSSMKVRHYHDELELFVLTEGERYFFVDRYIYHMKAGMAMLIPPGQIHKTSLVENKPVHGRYMLQMSKDIYDSVLAGMLDRSYEEMCHDHAGVISFAPDAWERFLTKLEELKRVTMTQEDIEQQISGNASEEAGKFHDLERAISSAPATSSDPYSRARIRCLASEVLLLFWAEADRIRSAKAAAHPTEYLADSNVFDKIHSITEYLNEHLAENITLDDLAGQFFVSRAGLTRAFKNVTGTTVIQYLTVIRVRHACQLLRESEESVTVIADRCGFGNVTYFEKVFKRMKGSTPMQYRKRVG